MTQVRIIADDLTGALDTAAQFATPRRAMPVFLNGHLPATLPKAFAIDAATRDMDSAAASMVAARDAPLLAPKAGAIAFKKLDSLLRGHCGIELFATLRAVREGLGWEGCGTTPASSSPLPAPSQDSPTARISGWGKL